ncbi:endonuclease NucS domain-containing protein [Bacillus pseudomycoides]|uniref:endonuclease NucS domain-containing protein n=1 Tax=Bacillus pseudomycoides TaxID=64104 RepID=UPI000BEBEDCD|nr:endonuclease NucS domain-containing protein [Bacillus pseudomycoides]PEE40544.1 recombinase RecB [Bacillus pseudomycoides]PGA88926.1 recombinase RecB [Bacillus pseudomycoides]
MPIEVSIWKVNDDVKKVDYSPIESEKKLEAILEKDLSILSDDLLLIGRQIRTNYGKFIDMLAIDPEGNLSIIELKRNRTPREVVAQVLDYASWVQNLSHKQILSIFEDKQGALLAEAFANKFDIDLPDKLNESHQLIIVSAQLDTETERIINYLSNNYGLPINAVFFRYFKEDNQEFITRSWLLDPNVIEERTSNTKSESKKEVWNEQDFVVNFEDGEYRSWEDAIKYGFISAGNGKWYSRTLNQLFVGARVFCMIPKSGYVGVGKVIQGVKPIQDATIKIGNEHKKLTDLSLRAPEMLHDLDDNELCEHVVLIEWIKCIPKEGAFWIKGLKANQNSAYKLRSQYTIEKVLEHFEIEED